MFIKPQFGDFEKDVVKLYKTGRSIYSICKEFSCHNRNITRILQQAGLDTSTKRKVRQDPLINHTQEIINLYQSGIGTHRISKQFNTSDTNISRLLKKNGIIIRPLETTWKVDDNYFKQLDTAEKSYSFGFFCSDGHVERTLIRLSLQARDKEILHKIAKSMQYTGDLKFVPRRKAETQDQMKLQICRTEMVKDIIALGCPMKKSLIMEFPTTIPNEFLHCFIRGFYDGNGTISIKEGHGNYVGVTSTIMFNAKLKEIIKNNTGVDCLEYICDNGINSSLRLNRLELIEKFLVYLYRDATIFMDRKYQKAIKLFPHLSSIVHPTSLAA